MAKKKKNKKNNNYNLKTAQTSSAKAWKQGNSGKPLEVPSGNTALVRAPGMQVFMANGMIPNSLMAIVKEAIETGKPPKMDSLEINEETLAEFAKLIDDVTVYCVVEPPVHPIPETTLNPETGQEVVGERDDDLLYVDEVDMEDKVFIFQFAVGGTRDLAKFRKEQNASLAALPASEGVESQA